MKSISKIIKYKHFWSLLLVVIFGVLASRTLIFQKGYFNMHDDLQMMRQLVMEQCFLDGQIPCRWTPHMGYGFGFPLFNYYPPLPYLIGEVFRVVGFTFVTTVKLTFALSIILSGITMYFLAGEFFPTFSKIRGKKFNLGAILSAVFYVWAPYHSVDVYVRGAMNEAWALTWFPLLFWTAYKLIKDKKNSTKWIIAFALSYFALFVSHNLMILIFTPLLGAWILMWMWRENAWSRLLSFVKSGFLAFGLAAFFTLPVLLEKSLVQVDTLVVGYYEYIAHFVSVKQLFITRFWGYGPSVWMEKDDGMPFQIGHIHWLLALILTIWLFNQLWPKRKKLLKFIKTKPILLVSSFMLLAGWFSAFLTHSRSTPIWNLVGPLEFVQFPWRFLTIVTFTFSFMAGAIVYIVKDEKVRNWIIGSLTLVLLALNWNYFLPEHGKMGPLTDEEKFSGVAWEMQQTAGIYDYLPTVAWQAPQEPRKYLAETMEGEGVFSNEEEGTNWANLEANIETETAIVRLGIFQYPNWEVLVDGEKVETYVDEKENWGRMYFEIDKGEHQLELKLKNTAPRVAGNIISLITWIGLITFPRWKKKLE